jgi:hypothetical protein
VWLWMVAFWKYVQPLQSFASCCDPFWPSVVNDAPEAGVEKCPGLQHGCFSSSSFLRSIEYDGIYVEYPIWWSSNLLLF